MKEKTFRMLKPGDKVHQVIVKNSQVVKNAVGGAETEFVVKEVKQIDFYNFQLVLNKLKVNINGEFYEDETTANNILVINVDGNSEIKRTEMESTDTLGIGINTTFYGTKKRELRDYIFSVLEVKREKAERIKREINKFLDNLQITAMEATHMNFKQEDEQERLEEEMAQEMDMELAASMAL